MIGGKKSIQVSEHNYERLCKMKDSLHYRSIDNVIEFMIIERDFRMKKP